VPINARLSVICATLSKENVLLLKMSKLKNMMTVDTSEDAGYKGITFYVDTEV
jgi:predicted xylose isomerase-like sugar epimerase